jgi:archaellum component FlaC
MDEDTKKLEVALSQTTVPNAQIEQAVIGPAASNATSLYSSENPVKGSPSSTPIATTGNALKGPGAHNKSNKNLSHACDSSTYVGKAIYEAGAIGGKIVKAIREGIKAILKYFGYNPSASGITSQLKALAQEVKDTIKIVKDITDAINKYISYVNAIRKLIAYISNLPAILLSYFADCIRTLQKQLVAGFQSAFGDEVNATGTTDTTSEDIKNLQKDVKDLNKSVATLTKTAVAAVNITVSTAAQAIAVQKVYSQAGFNNITGKFTKA